MSESQFDRSPYRYVIEQGQFQENCNKGKCPYRNLQSKNCIKENKQVKCYDRYVESKKKQLDKFFQKDYKWEELKESIALRDNNECLAYRILTNDEIKIVEQSDDYWLQSKFLDGAHIVPRQSAPEHIYNQDNVILLGRFFHQRIDSYLDLITGEFIGLDGSARWWTRIMQENGRWSNNFTYWDFRGQLINEKNKI